MFSSFKSRWMIRLLCKYYNACKICRNIFFNSFSVYIPSLIMLWTKSPPSINSVTRYNFPGETITWWNSRMFGWFKLLNILASEWMSCLSMSASLTSAVVNWHLLKCLNFSSSIIFTANTSPVYFFLQVNTLAKLPFPRYYPFDYLVHLLFFFSKKTYSSGSLLLP